MLKRKELFDMIQSYEQRLGGLDVFLQQLAFGNYSVSPLFDKFGPATTDADIEAIVITPESIDTAQQSTHLSHLFCQ
jgi:phosphopantetheine adenylyltransferase